MKRAVLVIFIFSLLPWMGSAQVVSGYQGKRFILGYELSAFPAPAGKMLAGPAIEDHEGIDHVFRLLSMHQLHIQYQNGRRKIIGAVVGYGVAHPYAEYKHYYTDEYGFDAYDYRWYQVSTANLLLGIDVTGYRGLRKANTLAPVGKYIRFRIANVWMNVLDKQSFAIQSNVTDSTKPKISKGVLSGIVCSLAFGSSRIIKDHIFFDFNTQLQVGLPFNETQPLFNRKPVSGVMSGDPTSDFEEYYVNRYFIAFNLGIGGLLF